MISLGSKGIQFLLVLNSRKNVENSFADLRCFLQNPSFICKSFSSNEAVTHDREKQKKEPTFAVSYLMNSCGLSLESAKLLSKRVNFESPEKPDSVLRLLRKHGFTETHISKLIKRHPELLLGNAEKTLLPKFEFFDSVGISGADLANMLSSNPVILGRSLKNQIIPSYNFLKGLISDEGKIANVLKRAVYLHDMQKHFLPNISLLREVGVTQSGIESLVISNPCVLCESKEKFREDVMNVVEMGFNPSTMAFVGAVIALSATTEESREQKREVFRKWGWSEDDLLLAFAKYPRFITLSVENVNNTMDFFVNKMGWNATAVAKVPNILAYSLEKRIVPRCSVVKVLQLKGLLKGKFNFSSVVMSSEKYFIVKFVSGYENDVPELMDLLQGKIILSDLGFKFEQKCRSKR